MKTLTILSVMILLLAPMAFTGCGQNNDSADQAAESASQDQVATHDCDGDCGMKDVPMDQLTEIDGKYYCAGCAHKIEAEDDHSGHDHD